MPSYDTSGNPQRALYPGDSFLLNNAEIIAANLIATKQVALGNSIYQPSKAATIELQFAGNPGAFTFDLQEADTDTNGAYQDIGAAHLTQATAGSDGNYYARIDLSPLQGAWIRGMWTVEPANAVAVTVKITRQ